jgi:hypothetical protein
MELDNEHHPRLAEHLETAELQAHDVTKITDEHPDMDWDDAYAIQDEIRRRKEARGNKIAGLKCGLTSFAKMKQMGVEVPVFGFVADYMARRTAGHQARRADPPEGRSRNLHRHQGPAEGPRLPRRRGDGRHRLRAAGRRSHRLPLPRLQVRPEERDRRQHPPAS